MTGRLLVALATVVAMTSGAAATSSDVGGGTATGTAPTTDSVRMPADRAAAPAAAGPAASAHERLGDHRAEVEALLEAVAGAFRSGDPEALVPWLHEPDGAFGRAWRERAAAMVGVPFEAYEIALDGAVPDLTTADVPTDGGLLVAAVERFVLSGTGALGPAEGDLVLTLRPRAGRWTVAGDTSGGRFGLATTRHLWDRGPVEVERRGDVLLLHGGGDTPVDTLFADAQAALPLVRDRWEGEWPGLLVLQVPRDAEELGDLLQVSFDLDDFVAFAVADLVDVLGDRRASGVRVLVNPDRFLDRPVEFRRSVLVHELLHVATRPLTGAAVPVWLEEGVAQAIGQQRSSTGTRQLSTVPASQLVPPADALFTAGTTDDTRRSYQLAWAFVDHLVRVHGVDAVIAAYAAAGDGGDGLPGTDAARLDAALVEHLGGTLDQLVDGWRAAA